jgi:hypothetical protein
MKESSPSAPPCGAMEVGNHIDGNTRLTSAGKSRSIVFFYAGVYYLRHTRTGALSCIGCSVQDANPTLREAVGSAPLIKTSSCCSMRSSIESRPPRSSSPCAKSCCNEPPSLKFPCISPENRELICSTLLCVVIDRMERRCWVETRISRVPFLMLEESAENCATDVIDWP